MLGTATSFFVNSFISSNILIDFSSFLRAQYTVLIGTKGFPKREASLYPCNQPAFGSAAIELYSSIH